MSLAWACALCCVVGAADLRLEPPLDPIAGSFSAVVYWRGEAPPSPASFQLIEADGRTAWEDVADFSHGLRRAALGCDTHRFPDGVYRLRVTAGGQEDWTTIRLRQGRESLPDRRPFRNRMLWMPMTGCTDAQLDDAVRAGYDTLFTKVGPRRPSPGEPIDFSESDALLKKAQARGMKLLVGWLLWTALPPDQFWLVRAEGTRIANRIDPCWDEAMAQVREFAERLQDHYRGCADVIALAPTWGIYGEAGYAELNAGYSPQALEKFNRWLIARGEAAAGKLPDASDAYHWLLWHRFRFEYLAAVWGELQAHLQQRESNGIKIGTWQEIYNGHMYDLALSEAPGAQFAINEMCFPWGTTYDQSRAIGETMGVRYKCRNFREYRDYYRPLIARKWAEGQQAIGCQLSNAYAEENYAWPAGTAARLGFDRWDDRFAATIRRVRDTAIVDEPAEVAYVQMTYPAAILPDAGNAVTDLNLYEVVLRMYGVAYDRIPITRLSRLHRADLARYKLIVVPDAWYLDEAMWQTLKGSGAQVLVTGGVMQMGDGGLIADGGRRTLDGLTLTYGATAAGTPEIAPNCPEAMAAPLREVLRQTPVNLPTDRGLADIEGATVELTLGGKLLVARKDTFHFVSNRLIFVCAYDPARPIPQLSGSKDPSANEGDPWGLASSSSPANRFGEAVLRGLIEASGATVRISKPLPRMYSRYLGDHVERINVTGNIVVNQDCVPHTIDVVCSRAVANFPCTARSGRWLVRVKVPAYDFAALAYRVP